MKKSKILLPLLAALMASGSLVGCGGGNDPTVKPSPTTTTPSVNPTPSGQPGTPTPSTPVGEFSFTIALESGKTALEVEDTDKIAINAVNAGSNRNYEYTSSNANVLAVDAEGNITAVAAGRASITVKETVSNLTQRLAITVTAKSEAVPATGGFNYAAESIQTRTEILGKLEKYAMDSHLTGITLFENGGYVKYSNRLTIPADEYITGYGYGILSEGRIDKSIKLPGEDNEAYQGYYHSATSSDPLTINALNATGSQVSDLSSYITSSYWGTKLNANRTGYEWYPVLALDKVNGKDNLRPIPAEEENPLGLYRKWKIYVKTEEQGLKYSTLSQARAKYNDRGVKLEDYEFIYQFLLTGNNKFKRGTELAGDTTHGIKGAQTFNRRTANMTDQAQIDALWNSMVESDELGIHTGKDEVGSYITLELVTSIDAFTAMYTLSSNLYSPLPREFLEEIGDGSLIDAAARYGSFNNGGNDAILDYTLCLGAYTLEKWEKKQVTIFKRASNWIETDRYFIEGVKIIVIAKATEDELAIYNEFENGKLDACGIPTKKLASEIGKEGVRKTKGDATFKLNVNSCTQEEWDALFGPNGKINKGSNWEVKPWMSNDNFLNGLFWSINRKEFADKRGVQPSINYFSDAYLSDPENGLSYNETDEHKAAIKNYHDVVNGVDNYGYSFDRATGYFKNAVSELVRTGAIKKGTTSKPTEIKIHIKWMYQNDTTEYGDDIKNYFESAFNHESVSGGTVKLVVTQDAVTNWEDVYNEVLMKGQFDLGFGAISGNTYSPLNFLEVLKSDNSSGFTLNWGTDTSKLDEKHPIEYDGRAWAFDALWETSDHGGIVENGVNIKSVKSCYLELPKKADGATTDSLLETKTIELPIEFANVDDVEFGISDVQLYLAGVGGKKVQWSVNNELNKILVTIDSDLIQEWNEEVRVSNKIDDEQEEEKQIKNPLTLFYYGMFWTIDVSYTISIKGGTPTLTTITAAKNADAVEE